MAASLAPITDDRAVTRQGPRARLFSAQLGRDVLQHAFCGLAERNPIRVHLHVVRPVSRDQHKTTGASDGWSIDHGYLIQETSA